MCVKFIGNFDCILYLGGLFFLGQTRVVHLCTTITEPLEYTFGTTRCWRRDFKINESIIYCDKIDDNDKDYR